jgi:hypothetical protein
MPSNVLLPALFGAVFQEMLRWLPLLARKPTAAEKARVTSGWYLVPALLVVAGGTVGTYYFTLDSAATPLHCMALGAAFPSLFKKLVDSVAGVRDKPALEAGPKADATPRLGEPQIGPQVLREFFR